MNNKKVRIAIYAVVLVVLLTVLIFDLRKLLTLNSAKDPTDHTTSISDNNVESTVSDNSISIEKSGDVLMDYTANNCQYYDYYDVKNVAKEDFFNIVNYNLMIYGDNSYAERTTTDQVYEELLANTTGELHLKFRHEDDGLYISTHTYEDRVNPLATVKLVSNGDKMEVDAGE